MNLMCKVAYILWCRVVHGHVMEKIGAIPGAEDWTLYACARCGRVENLHTVARM